MKAYSIDLRQKIIETYKNKEGSIRQVSQRFKVSRSFVQKLLKQHQLLGSVAPLSHAGGTGPKLADYVAIIEEILQKKNDATLPELCQILKERAGINVSPSTMCRFLHKLNLTRKKTFQASQAATERVQNLRFEYWEIVRDAKPEDLIFIDETGLNLGLARTYARSTQGLRAYGERPYQRGKNISLIGALALKGLVGAMTVNGGTNGDVFRAFVEQILVPNLWSGAIVIMDNLTAHKVKGIQETIEAAGAKVVYLSPYSPDFNPIENCWSKLKEYLRSVAARSRDALEVALNAGKRANFS